MTKLVKPLLLFAGSVAIGIQCNSPEFRKMKQQAMQSFPQFPMNIFTIVYPNLARFFGIRKHAEEVCDFFIDVIKQAIQSRAKNNENRNDFLQLLMHGSDLTTHQIAALAFDFLSAGYSDSTSTLSYCLYELALPKNEKVQTKAREEIESVLNQHSGQITYDALRKMDYCKSIIKGKSVMISLKSIPELVFICTFEFHRRNIAETPSCGQYHKDRNKAVQSAKHQLYDCRRDAHLCADFSDASRRTLFLSSKSIRSRAIFRW